MADHEADPGRPEREDLPGGDGSPPLDFTTFILSMSTTCMMQLGELEAPDGFHADLPMARNSLEILMILEEKTKGNLSGEEERVLHHVVDDLRQRYLARVAR